MSQRSTKVRPCPCPGHPPIFPGPAGSSGPAQLAGSRLRVQKEGTDSISRAQTLGLPQPGDPSPIRDPSPWPGGGEALAQKPQLLGRRKPPAGSAVQSPEGETRSLATELAHSLARAWHLPDRSEAAWR